MDSRRSNDAGCAESVAGEAVELVLANDESVLAAPSEVSAAAPDEIGSDIDEDDAAAASLLDCDIVDDSPAG